MVAMKEFSLVAVTDDSEEEQMVVHMVAPTDDGTAALKVDYLVEMQAG